MRVLGLGLRRWDRRQVPLAAAELPPRALCRVSFLLFTSLRPVFFEEFWDCFSLPPFWDKVLNNPDWSRSQKLGPKVIKYWSHRLATVLGTCVTLLLTWAFRSSRCHPAVFLLCVRGDLLCIKGDLLLEWVARTAGCVPGCVQITICQSSPAERHYSQDFFLHTSFTIRRKHPLFLWPWWKRKGIKRGCIYSLSQSSQEQDIIVIFQKLRPCSKSYCVWQSRRFCLLVFQMLLTFN